MSIGTQAKALGTLGAAMRRSAFREESHTAITYRTRDAASATTLASAYWSETGTTRDGDAGLQEIAPDGVLSVLRSELASVTVGALVVQGSDRYRVESFRQAPGGVEWVITVARST